MKFWASTAFSPPEHYVPLAKAADAAGIDGMLMSDHVFYPRDLTTPYPYSGDGSPIWPPDTAWPDNWVTIGAMAGATERIHFADRGLHRARATSSPSPRRSAPRR